MIPVWIHLETHPIKLHPATAFNNHVNCNNNTRGLNEQKPSHVQTGEAEIQEETRHSEIQNFWAEGSSPDLTACWHVTCSHGSCYLGLTLGFRTAERGQKSNKGSKKSLKPEKNTRILELKDFHNKLHLIWFASGGLQSHTTENLHHLRNQTSKQISMASLLHSCCHLSQHWRMISLRMKNHP